MTKAPMLTENPPKSKVTTQITATKISDYTTITDQHLGRSVRRSYSYQTGVVKIGLRAKNFPTNRKSCVLKTSTSAHQIIDF